MNTSRPKTKIAPRTINKSAPKTRSTTSMGSYFEYNIIQKIGRTKFPVFYVECQLTNKKYALKAFALQNERPSSHFTNEARMFGYKHPNILSVISAKLKSCIKYKEKILNCSYIVMELSPYRDFNDLMNERKFFADEKLVRTYFHHLIEGLEYLHSKGIAHLDLKPENLLMGEDCLLKIADFDRSSFLSDKDFNSRGTEDFRAPEVMKGKIEDPCAADVFSAGIILFVFLNSVIPFTEDINKPCYQFLKLLVDGDDRFWRQHKEINGLNCDEEFKDLFFGMTCWNHRERVKISEVKLYPWYQRDCYSDSELAALMPKRLGNKYKYKT
jgi:serine/threonine protein kinase